MRAIPCSSGSRTTASARTERDSRHELSRTPYPRAHEATHIGALFRDRSSLGLTHWCAVVAIVGGGENVGLLVAALVRSFVDAERRMEKKRGGEAGGGRQEAGGGRRGGEKEGRREEEEERNGEGREMTGREGGAWPHPECKL